MPLGRPTSHLESRKSTPTCRLHSRRGQCFLRVRATTVKSTALSWQKFVVHHYRNKHLPPGRAKNNTRKGTNEPNTARGVACAYSHLFLRESLYSCFLASRGTTVPSFSDALAFQIRRFVSSLPVITNLIVTCITCVTFVSGRWEQ